jgi:hypothetical protein
MRTMDEDRYRIRNDERNNDPDHSSPSESRNNDPDLEEITE